MRLTFHNLKKAKGQYVSFGIMILLTALIMNIALVLNSQTSKAYDLAFEKLNTAHINVFIPKALDSDEVYDHIKGLDGVRHTENHSCVFLTAVLHNFAGSDFDMNTVFYRADEERSLNLLDIETAAQNDKDLIYVPKYITQLGQFTVGEKISYQIEGEDTEYTIGGTVSEMQYGNYGTGLIGVYLPKSAYESLALKFENKRMAEYSIKTAEDADLTQVKKDITEFLKSKNIPVVNIGDCNTAKQTRTMVCNLLIIIFLAMSAIVLLVSLFLSGFRIRNSMEDEMTNMGVLKAIGYTSAGIIASVTAPYIIVGAVSAVSGAVISYALLPSVAGFLAMQSGFSYTPVFDISAFLMTVLIPVALIFAFSVYSAKRIRNLEPISAIRGIKNSKADKNRFPLDSTKTGVKFTLVLKQIFSSSSQNILLFVLSFGIMILLSFAGTLFYNVNIKPDNFINTLSEESPSVIFNAKADKKQELKNALEKDSGVSRVIEYAADTVSFARGSIKCFVCEDFSLVLNNICYKGNDPAAENEIALGSALAEQYDIGSKIEISADGKSSIYTVTGYVQSVNNNGNVCELTSEGYKKISNAAPNSFNIYLKNGKAEEFIDKWEQDHGELIDSSLNYEKLKEGGQKLYSAIVAAVTALLFVISVLVVLLVMYIMISSMITRRRQELGIYKAIGWSNRQLVTQSAMCFVPVIAVSAFLSAFAGLIYMPAINNAVFGILGAMKNRFEVSVWFLLIFAGLFVFVSYVISVILSRPIKKITAYSLLKE